MRPFVNKLLKTTVPNAGADFIQESQNENLEDWEEEEELQVNVFYSEEVEGKKVGYSLFTLMKN